jgi:hypothetical protein
LSTEQKRATWILLIAHSSSLIAVVTPGAVCVSSSRRSPAPHPCGE